MSVVKPTPNGSISIIEHNNVWDMSDDEMYALSMCRKGPLH
jgi:hypothetical protein